MQKSLIKKCGKAKNKNLCQARKRCKDSTHLHKKGEKANPDVSSSRIQNKTEEKHFNKILCDLPEGLTTVGPKKTKKYVEKSSIMINQIRVCKYGSQEALGPFSESGERKKHVHEELKKKSPVLRKFYLQRGFCSWNPLCTVPRRNISKF